MVAVRPCTAGTLPRTVVVVVVLPDMVVLCALCALCALLCSAVVRLSVAVDLLYMAVDVENMVVVRCRAVLVVAALQHTVALLASVVAANGPLDIAAEE